MDLLDALQSIRDNGCSDGSFEAVLDDLVTTSHFADLDKESKRRLVAIAYLRSQGNDYEAEEVSISGIVISAAGNDYLILTDDEATEHCMEHINESLWAFNTNFLASATGLDESVFEALQPQCESANRAIRALIHATCGFDDFCEEAISADGRGHFLNPYDGEEREFDTYDGCYFIYDQG